LTYLYRHHVKSLQSALTVGLWRPGELAERTAGWVLNGKAVVQLALAERSLLARTLKDPELIGAAERLRDARIRLAQLTFAVPPAGQEERFRERLRVLAAEEQRLARELGGRAGRAPEAESWIPVETVRQAVPADAVLLDMVKISVNDGFTEQPTWNQARYAAWVIPAAGRGPVRLIDLGSAAPIDAAVEQLRQGLTRPPAGLTDAAERQAERDLAQKAEAVARRVLWPLLGPAGDARRWLICPDAALWLVPWAALPLRDGTPALETYRFSYLVSGRDLLAPAPPAGAAGAVVFADPDFDLDPAEAAAEARRLRQAGPTLALRNHSSAWLRSARWPRLPGTAAEARAVAPKLARYAGAEPTVYAGRQALEGVFKSVHRPRVLVLATHGFFLEDQDRAVVPDSQRRPSGRGLELVPAGPPPGRDGGPAELLENPLLRCGLVLAGANRRAAGDDAPGDDGLLTGLEILTVDLRGTEMVVLSACETGVGRVRHGEGVAGLRQAFQLAGARSVVASLWQVPDRETSELMARFFDHLAAGVGRADALRQAQLDVLRQRRERRGAAHPFYWAAFTLTGDWR
jgi:hypothetical protein